MKFVAIAAATLLAAGTLVYSRAVRWLVLAAVPFLPTFVAAAQGTVLQVAAGSDHTCSVVAGGGVKCWGGGNRTPVDISGLSFPVAAVALGAFHSCALSTSGGVACWGANSRGQLGDSTNLGRGTPVDVVGLSSGVTAIAAGYIHTCALTTSGGVLCWGGNSSGQLGDGTYADRNTPGPVVGLSTGVVGIAAGYENSAAITSGGGVKYWGKDGQGYQECLPTDPWWPVPPGSNCKTVNVYSTTPKYAPSLPGGVTAVSIAADILVSYSLFYNLCALAPGGRVMCWLGSANPASQPAADFDGLSAGVTAISMGGSHSCVLTSGGIAQCWGGNMQGQLGDGTTEVRRRDTPKPVLGVPSGLVQIVAGGRHTCALTAIGEVLCWGANDAGQLGDGTTIDRLAPVAVNLSSAPNYQGLWWKSPRGAESGWGINIAHQGDVIFATWFTYDATGKAWWLSMTANKNPDGTYSGTLYETSGPAFNAVPFDPNQVTRTPVGSGTLTFSSASSGTFTYTVKGIAQTKSIVPLAFGPLSTCVWGAQPDLTKATNFQDLWWAVPAGTESGWGINLTQQGTTIFATWFTYDMDRSPLWYSVTAPQAAPNTFTGTLYRTAGPAFSAEPFNPDLVRRTPIGTAMLTFTNGNAGMFAYQVTDGANVANQTKAITRLVFRAPGTVCQ